MPEEGVLSQIKRIVVGQPIPSHLAHHERFSRVTGLAVLSSDALSSVAYATEEVLRVLIIAGVGALSFANPIAFVIAMILAVVVFSYRQTIHAYPTGGGAYLVAKENLGETPALIAAGALLIDYVLTVAVSIAAGVAAITSAFPDWHVNRVEMALGLMLLLMVGNLRGVRESGRIFAAPTYVFIVAVLMMIGLGTWRVLSGDVAPVVAAEPLQPVGGPLTLFLLLTAFSNGCTAMTGVEAVSNGVPAFRPPESRNAATTMLLMAVLSIAMFIGITALARAYHVVPSDQETVVSQIARGVLYFLVQAGTMLILVHWRRRRAPGWRTSAWINGFGSAVTGIVLLVVAVTKAHEGAWLVLVLIPMHVVFFVLTRRHYEQVATQLSLKGWTPSPAHRNRVVVPIGGVHRAVVQAVEYAKSLSSDVRAVYVSIDPVTTDQVRSEWQVWGQGVPLVVLDSPYRSLMEPLLEYVDRLEAEHPDDFVTVVLPEFVPARWWHHVFHNQRALLIKGALLFTRHIVVTSVPFHLSR